MFALPRTPYEYRARICKRSRSPEIDSSESISGLPKRLQIRAQWVATAWYYCKRNLTY
jgi:hypothetical protein